MSNYTHILAAVDLKQHSNQVMLCAANIAKRLQARLTLLHVVEYFPVDTGEEAMPPMSPENSEDMVAQARQRLRERAGQCEIEDAGQIIVVGDIKDGIISSARENEADLVVFGNHERHGLAVLLNYTEDTILHQAPCDILAVRV
jgi:universal stress protein A